MRRVSEVSGCESVCVLWVGSSKPHKAWGDIVHDHRGELFVKIDIRTRDGFWDLTEEHSRTDLGDYEGPDIMEDGGSRACDSSSNSSGGSGGESGGGLSPAPNGGNGDTVTCESDGGFNNSSSGGSRDYGHTFADYDAREGGC